MDGVRIHITGIVQGVGFRPFVYNLAGKYNLSGFCLNDSEGVVIEAQGPQVDRFIDEIKSYPPPLARIESIKVERFEGEPHKGFTIRESEPVEGKFVLISPDISICADCHREMFDPGDRRYLYPFINCTNCGPRYSIVKDIPYDRPRTTMARFRLCRVCEEEYHNPADRRFHAQPNACAVCGPRTWLVDKSGTRIDGFNFDAIKRAQALLSEGHILAIKGLGGFHLACDASNDEAVKRLREKKRKSLSKGYGSNKPFAVMSADIGTARSFVFISKQEEELLTGRIRPIVLLKKTYPEALSIHVAPNSRDYGVMLPYTPLHYLIFHKAPFKALVMTSGNLAEEPIVISNDEAVKRLSEIADSFLLHDRDIYMRVDDSIARVEKKTVTFRRARGFTPEPIDLNEPMEEILATGAELKNTFCITKDRFAILSQHIGDLENMEALGFYQETLKNLKNSFKATPKIIAHDMHPDYMSTTFAREYAKEENISEDKIIAVQHHHAHIVSVMAEHNLKERIIGVAFDGTGYGVDGNIWGGEFLIAERKSFTRAAHLGYIGLPGGDKAVKEPWRTAVSYLKYAYGDYAPEMIEKYYPRFATKEAGAVLQMLDRNLNCPLTSSAGRLFDGVASLAGVRDRVTFEAEAAIEMEALADISRTATERAYPYEVTGTSPMVIDARPLIKAVVEDVSKGTAASIIAIRFHITVAQMILDVLKRLKEATAITKVAMSGGVFQNRLLTAITRERLEREGFTLYMNEKVPANDGGISLGQAVSAWEKVKGE